VLCEDRIALEQFFDRSTFFYCYDHSRDLT
jgi:hypothetical protein